MSDKEKATNLVKDIEKVIQSISSEERFTFTMLLFGCLTHLIEDKDLSLQLMSISTIYLTRRMSPDNIIDMIRKTIKSDKENEPKAL